MRYAVALLTLLAGCQPTRREEATPVVLAGAGDVASDGGEQAATAALLAATEGAIFTLGDNAYNDGSAADFAKWFTPTWGAFLARIRPAVGNHEYHVAGATDYFAYFGAAAGTPGEGWYSYDYGAWHVVVLNANCTQVDCAAGSKQEAWLRADLAASPARCKLAYFHQTPVSSGQDGNHPELQALWDGLVAGGVDVTLAGHDHDYERFAPRDGIRSFVVGTGGAPLRPFREPPEAGSEARDAETHGILVLTLRARGYDWELRPVAGQPFTDAGSDECS